MSSAIPRATLLNISALVCERLRGPTQARDVRPYQISQAVRLCCDFVTEEKQGWLEDRMAGRLAPDTKAAASRAEGLIRRSDSTAASRRLQPGPSAPAVPGTFMWGALIALVIGRCPVSIISLLSTSATHLLAT